MPLHTPQSIWAKYKQPMAELALDGCGVSLGGNTYLVIRWSPNLDSRQVSKWLAFFATAWSGKGDPGEVLGIEPLGASSTVVSLEELKRGLALLNQLQVDKRATLERGEESSNG